MFPCTLLCRFLILCFFWSQPGTIPCFLFFSCLKPGYRACDFLSSFCAYLNQPEVSGSGAKLHIWTKSCTFYVLLPVTVIDFSFPFRIQENPHSGLLLPFAFAAFCNPRKHRISTGTAKGLFFMVHLHFSDSHTNFLYSSFAHPQAHVTARFQPFDFLSRSSFVISGWNTLSMLQFSTISSLLFQYPTASPAR